MFKRCLVCNTPFPTNDLLEHFPTVERVVFDHTRGWLRVVCRRL